MADVEYQRSGQVRQALAERANAVRLGAVDRVKAADKTLAALGYSEPEAAPAVERSSPPAGRATRQERASKTAAPAPASVEKPQAKG